MRLKVKRDHTDKAGQQRHFKSSVLSLLSWGSALCEVGRSLKHCRH